MAKAKQAIDLFGFRFRYPEHDGFDRCTCPVESFIIKKLSTSLSCPVSGQDGEFN
jgi:hypothetical protein